MLLLTALAAGLTVLTIKKMEYDWGGPVAFIWFIWAVVIWIPPFWSGVHINTGTGEHVGYITSVEKSGILFKTYTAYLKTDQQSSQEDAYCILDKDLAKELQEFSENNTRVSVHYFSWLAAGVRNCGTEGAIIDAVKIINK